MACRQGADYLMIDDSRWHWKTTPRRYFLDGCLLAVPAGDIFTPVLAYLSPYCC